MFGKIFITRSGYDPEMGRHVKDPYLGDMPSIGACRPDIRKKVKPGDHIFTISGRLPFRRGEPRPEQFVMGGFEVAEKLLALEAFERFPEQRLRVLPDGQLSGNVVVDGNGQQHALDTHASKTFDDRKHNYVVGRDPVVISTSAQIALARAETLDALQEIFKKRGVRAIDIVGRWGATLSERQVESLRDWLQSIVRRAS